jgi:hypothetical protein
MHPSLVTGLINLYFDSHASLPVTGLINLSLDSHASLPVTGLINLIWIHMHHSQ